MRCAIIALWLSLAILSQPAQAFDPSRLIRWGEEATEWIVGKVAPAAKEAKASVPMKPKFTNTTILGDLGEDVTRLIMEARGYTRLGANKKHGIDGIFAKFDDAGEISEVVVTETKAKNTLGPWPAFPPADNPTQMSDVWIEQRLLDEIKHPAISVGDRVLLETAYERFTQGMLELRRELWRHSVPEGKTTRYTLDRDGKIIPGSEVEVKERHLERLIERKCTEKTLPCEPVS